MKEKWKRATLLPAIALGMAALLGSGTALAANSTPERLKSETSVNVSDINVTDKTFTSINTNDANNGWGLNSDGEQQWRGGGLLFALNSTSSDTDLLGLWPTLSGTGIAAVPITSVTVTGAKVNGYTSNITWDNANAGSNGYGPIMIYGGSGIANGMLAGTFSEVVTNFAVKQQGLAGKGSSAWGGTAYIANVADMKISGAYASGALNMTLDTGMSSEVYQARGGAVALMNTLAGSTATIGARFTNNTVKLTGGSASFGVGTAARGGAVSLFNTGTIHAKIDSGSVFSGNAAINEVNNGQAYGGAISSEGATLAITGTTFTNNYAKGRFAEGGAIWTNSALELNGVTFSGNYTMANGTRTDNAIHLSGAGASVKFVGSGTSSDKDGISGTGNITMDGTGSLELFGDYRNLNGDFILNAGTTYFDDATRINPLSQLNVLNESTALNLRDRTAGNTITVDAMQIDTDSTIAVTLGAANTTAAAIAVSGTLHIVGNFTLDVSSDGTLAAGSTYRAITASSTVGMNTANWNVNKHMLNYDVDVGSSGVDVTINSMRSVSSAAWTSNQSSLGNYLDNGNGDNDLYRYIYSDAQNDDDIRLALDTSMGDVYAGASGAIAQWDRRGNTMVIGRMNTVFLSDFTNTPVSAASDEALGNIDCGSTVSAIWAEADGYRYKSDYESGTGQGRTKGWGVSIGYDTRVDDWVFGAAFRYGDNRFEVKDHRSRVDSDSFSLSLYGGRRARVGSVMLHMMGGVTGGYHDMNGQRTQILGGVQNQFTSDYHTKTLSGYLDAGVTVGDTACFAVQPFVNAMWNGYWANSITEKGGNSSLHVRSENDDWWSTSVGMRAMGRVAEAVAFDVNAAWRHTYGKLSSTNRMRFIGSPSGERFTVRGTAMERNEGVVGAGVTFKLSDNVALRAGYDFTFGSGKARSHEGFVNLGISF